MNISDSIFYDLKEFFNYIIFSLNNDKNTEYVNKQISRHIVEWEGVVSDVVIRDDGAKITVEVPCSMNSDCAVGNIDLAIITLPVDASDVGLWKTVDVGDFIVFKAMLGTGLGVFPAVELGELGSERFYLIIRLNKAEFIRKLG